MHRIGGLEKERLAAVPAEDEKDAKKHFVAAVAEHELVGCHAPAIAEDLAERVAPTRVAVQQNLIEFARADVSARRIRLRPLVRLDAHVGAHLLGSVGLELRHLRAWSRELSLGHPHSLTGAGRPRSERERPDAAWGRWVSPLQCLELLRRAAPGAGDLSRRAALERESRTTYGARRRSYPASTPPYGWTLAPSPVCGMHRDTPGPSLLTKDPGGTVKSERAKGGSDCALCDAQEKGAEQHETHARARTERAIPWIALVVLSFAVPPFLGEADRVVAFGLCGALAAGAGLAWLTHRMNMRITEHMLEETTEELKTEADQRVSMVIRQFEWAVSDVTK